MASRLVVPAMPALPAAAPGPRPLARGGPGAGRRRRPRGRDGHRRRPAAARRRRPRRARTGPQPHDGRGRRARSPAPCPHFRTCSATACTSAASGCPARWSYVRGQRPPAGSASGATAPGGGATTPSRRSSRAPWTSRPTVSPDGGYLARMVTEAGGAMLVGADTARAARASAASTCPPATGTPHRPRRRRDRRRPGRGRGARFQRLWRPLVDGEPVDLAETAPGQVVLGNTAAGLLVNDGAYDAADGTQGDPYLATARRGRHPHPAALVPTHDVLEASEEWLAYVPGGHRRRRGVGHRRAAGGARRRRRRRRCSRRPRAGCSSPPASAGRATTGCSPPSSRWTAAPRPSCGAGRSPRRAC